MTMPRVCQAGIPVYLAPCATITDSVVFTIRHRSPAHGGPGPVGPKLPPSSPGLAAADRRVPDGRQARQPEQSLAESDGGPPVCPTDGLRGGTVRHSTRPAKPGH